MTSERLRLLMHPQQILTHLLKIDRYTAPSYTTHVHTYTCLHLHINTYTYTCLHLPLHQTTLANVAHQSLGTCLEPEVTNRRKINMNIVIRTKMMIISTILM